MTPQPPQHPTPSPDAGAADSDPSSMARQLDEYWRSRKEEGELQTTEIPISMLMALDKMVQANAAAPGVEGKTADPDTVSLPEGDRSDSSLPKGQGTADPESGLRKSAMTVRDLSGHLKRVAAYAKLLALKVGMPESEANFVKQIAPMHDIGKWAIPESILQKPSTLTPDEWAIMKTHAQAGYEMLKDSKLNVLQMGALVAVQHQEKYDGTGYPKGLKGEEIHIYSRITTVADVFDALGSERSYKQAWAVADIAQYFVEGRGTHFDPLLVDLLLGNLDEFLAVRDALPAGGQA